MSTSRLTSPALLLAALAGPVAAQEGYRLPPQEVVDLVDAPPAPGVRTSPDGEWMLFVESSALPSIADLSRPMLRLAGMRIDPAANARYRTSFDTGLLLRARDGGEARRVPLGAGEGDAGLASVSWSHDSRHFVYVLAGGEGSRLYGVSVGDPERSVLLTDRLCTVTGGVTWMPDGQTVLCHLVPEERGAAPVRSQTPTGPNVRETSGDTSPLRTYQDLLKSAHDEALFEHHATTQLALLDVAGGEPTTVGDPGVFAGAEPSPDGRWLLVTIVRRPYSYLMPWTSFPRTIVAWDRAGQGDHVVAELPLAENVPIGGVPLGPRSVQWNPHANAELLWVEALDGGDPNREAEARDHWLSHSAPFAAEPSELVRVEHRAQGLTFLEDSDLFITGEYDRDRRWARSLLHDRVHPDAEPRVLDDRSVRDRYGDPGSLVSEVDARGSWLVRIDDGRVYRTGAGASPEGLLPFLDAQDLATLETERLWRCAPGAYETPYDLLPRAQGQPLRFLTRHETPTSPPNHRLRNVGTGESRVLTEFPDPTPQLRGIHKELVTYERADGVPLSATLYLPARLRQEGDKASAARLGVPEGIQQRAGRRVRSARSPYRFTRIGGTVAPRSLLTQGYAIMDGATMPVVGSDPETDQRHVHRPDRCEPPRPRSTTAVEMRRCRRRPRRGSSEVTATARS